MRIMVRIKKTIRKLIKKGHDLSKRFNEKKYVSSYGVPLKYLYKSAKDSDTLLVGFSGCFDGGAIYNYVGACSEFKINKLFIKDDFAENHRGCYYLGSDGKYEVEQAVIELINLHKHNIRKIIFIGTSKGAYSAINFALEYNGSYVICGAPQYFVGDYLKSAKFDINLSYILGDINQKSMKELNERLRRKVLSVEPSQTINIIYSNVEHTYQEHIVHLLKDLHDKGYNVNEQVESFPNHGDIGKHFPEYLKKTLKRCI